MPASDPYLHLNLYRPASITECLSQLLSHRVTSRLGQRGQRLTSGTSAALVREAAALDATNASEFIRRAALAKLREIGVSVSSHRRPALAS